MLGVQELVILIYLGAVICYLLVIVNSVKIKEKKLLFVLLSILSLPVLMFLGKVVNNFLIQKNIITSFEAGAALFLSIAVSVLLIEIVIYLYIRKKRLKSV